MKEAWRSLRSSSLFWAERAGLAASVCGPHRLGSAEAKDEGARQQVDGGEGAKTTLKQKDAGETRTPRHGGSSSSRGSSNSNSNQARTV